MIIKPNWRNVERIRGNGDFVLPLIVERKRLEIPESDGREEKAEDLLRPPPRSVGKLVSFFLFCFIYAFIFPSFFPPNFSLCPMPKKKKDKLPVGYREWEQFRVGVFHKSKRYF